MISDYDWKNNHNKFPSYTFCLFGKYTYKIQVLIYTSTNIGTVCESKERPYYFWILILEALY